MGWLLGALLGASECTNTLGRAPKLETGTSAVAQSLLAAEAALEAVGVQLREGNKPLLPPWSTVATQQTPKRQQALSHALALTHRANLLQSLDDHAERARVRSCGGSGAGAWLQAVPQDRQLTLDDLTYRQAVRLRLGQALGTPGRCGLRTRAGRRCAETLDAQGHHAHRCAHGPHRMRRHNNLRDTCAQLLRDAGLRVTTEEYVPAWDQQRPDGTWLRAKLDLRVDGGPGVAAEYLDVVVGHPVSSCHATTRANGNSDGRQAGVEERGKHARYGAAVVPLAVETYGRWGKQASRWWRLLARFVAGNDPALAHHGRWAGSVLLARWWAVLSVGLQRDCAETVQAAFHAPRPCWCPEARAAPSAWELVSGSAGVADQCV